MFESASANCPCVILAMRNFLGTGKFNWGLWTGETSYFVYTIYIFFYTVLLNETPFLDWLPPSLFPQFKMLLPAGGISPSIAHPQFGDPLWNRASFARPVNLNNSNRLVAANAWAANAAKD